MPSILTEEQVEITLSKRDNHERLITLWALSHIAKAARYSATYSSAPEWSSAVVLSQDGEQIYQGAEFPTDTISESDAKMALFGRFYHHGLLIDVDKSDITTIRSIINSELLQSRMRLPFSFGRLMYDRFNKLFPAGHISKLSHSDVWNLLDGTPQGLFQIGNLLTGPLGLLESTQPRWYPPTANPGELWHTKRQGAATGYWVEFEPPPIGVVKAYELTAEVAIEKFGRASEWLLPLARRSCLYGPTQRYTDISLTIADCILGQERNRLVEHALKSPLGKQIRTILGPPPRKASFGQGTPEEIASRLAPEQQLQLLMLAKDTELAQFIDECCAKKSITIPTYEIRTAKRFVPSVDRSKSNQNQTELSASGARYSNTNSTITLVSIIAEAYKNAGALDDLSWKLRAYGPIPPLQALSEFIRAETPTAAVQKLVLSSRPATSSILSSLGISTVFEADHEIEKQILWKCGYNPTEYSQTLPRLRERLIEFNQVILMTGEVTDERGRAVIRSAGVNLFVSLEEFLENILTYNTWLLFSDHFVGKKLTYRYSDALKAVGDVLVPRITGTPDEEITWDLTGKNTLGPILHLLNELCQWVEGLVESERGSLLRPRSDVPLAMRGGPLRFAFEHTQLWADCGPNELLRFGKMLKDTVKLIQRADVAGVRNGLDHKRIDADFPSIDRMLSFVTHMTEAVERVEAGRLFPKEYWLQASGVDRYEQRWYQLSDYRGARLELRSPSHVSGLSWGSILTFDTPVIVAPASLLPVPNSELCFRVGHESLFTEYWSGYPILREIDDSSRQFSSVVP
jgi:hypothetical protein